MKVQSAHGCHEGAWDLWKFHFYTVVHNISGSCQAELDELSWPMMWTCSTLVVNGTSGGQWFGPSISLSSPFYRMTVRHGHQVVAWLNKSISFVLRPFGGLWNIVRITMVNEKILPPKDWITGYYLRNPWVPTPSIRVWTHDSLIISLPCLTGCLSKGQPRVENAKGMNTNLLAWRLPQRKAQDGIVGETTHLTQSVAFAEKSGRWTWIKKKSLTGRLYAFLTRTVHPANMKKGTVTSTWTPLWQRCRKESTLLITNAYNSC